ncbi:MAG: LLM class flavin-dependent oxidoreductase [Propionibacteriaceae bacterium]|nr:LLM class flavin-dependent oxidoreductase [Propionibacteriaceae bacterium]
MQFGIVSTADVVRDPITGITANDATRLDEIRLLARVVEEVGLDVFAVAEHHGAGFVGSSPATLLAAIAAETSRITLTTASSLITNNDPVRMAEEYALLQHLTHGRLDLMVGCGSTALVYPWPTDDCAANFELAVENYSLLRQLWREPNTDWEGRYRTPLINFTSTPRPLDGVPPFIWHHAHSTDVTDQAAYYGEGLFVNNMTDLRRDVSLVTDYRQRYETYGHGVATQAPVSLGGQVFVARTTQEAREGVRPYIDLSTYGMTLEEAIHHTSLAVGSPQEVIEKILKMRELYGDYQRQLFIIDPGGLPLWSILEQLEILGGSIVPALKTEFDNRRPAHVPSNPPTHEDRVRLTRV